MKIVKKYQFSLLDDTDRVVETRENTDFAVGRDPFTVLIDGLNSILEHPIDSLLLPKYFSSSFCSFFSFLLM